MNRNSLFLIGLLCFVESLFGAELKSNRLTSQTTESLYNLIAESKTDATPKNGPKKRQRDPFQSNDMVIPLDDNQDEESDESRLSPPSKRQKLHYDPNLPTPSKSRRDRNKNDRVTSKKNITTSDLDDREASTIRLKLGLSRLRNKRTLNDVLSKLPEFCEEVAFNGISAASMVGLLSQHSDDKGKKQIFNFFAKHPNIKDKIETFSESSHWEGVGPANLFYNLVNIGLKPSVIWQRKWVDWLSKNFNNFEKAEQFFFAARSLGCLDQTILEERQSSVTLFTAILKNKANITEDDLDKITLLHEKDLKRDKDVYDGKFVEILKGPDRRILKKSLAKLKPALSELKMKTNIDEILSRLPELSKEAAFNGITAYTVVNILFSHAYGEGKSKISSFFRNHPNLKNKIVELSGPATWIGYGTFILPYRLAQIDLKPSSEWQHKWVDWVEKNIDRFYTECNRPDSIFFLTASSLGSLDEEIAKDARQKFLGRWEYYSKSLPVKEINSLLFEYEREVAIRPEITKNSYAMAIIRDCQEMSKKKQDIGKRAGIHVASVALQTSPCHLEQQVIQNTSVQYPNRQAQAGWQCPWGKCDDGPFEDLDALMNHFTYEHGDDLFYKPYNCGCLDCYEIKYNSPQALYDHIYKKHLSKQQ